MRRLKEEASGRMGNVMKRYMAAALLLVTATSAQNTPRATKVRHLDIPAISREASGAIVSIVMSDKDGHPIAQGSGFLISKEGHVVTNYHVISNGSSAIVKLPNGAVFAVDGVLVSDRDRDVAVIKAHGNAFRVLNLGDSDRLQVGEEVVAIGNPLSLESTVSNGIVSAIRTDDKEGKFLQTTAPISPGSSGGPLFNMAGDVVGITTSHIKGGENLNFAIPINDVKPLLRSAFSNVRALPDEPEPETVTPDRTTGPSLADTLQWMVDSSVAEVEHVEEGLVMRFHISTQGSSCHAFEIVYTCDYKSRHAAIRTSERFDLSDVDPDSIHQDDGGIAFGFPENQNGISEAIQVAEDMDHLNSGRLISSQSLATTREGLFLIDDKTYSDRLTKAFRHAVVLCVGKPSTF